MTRSRPTVGQHVREGAAWAAGLIGLTLLGPVPVWASEGGGSGLISVNTSLILQIVNFLILLILLRRFLYRPLVAMLETRTATIQQRLAEAQAAREEAQRQLAEFEVKLQASQAEAQAARERALREAAETRERLMAEARREADRLLQGAQAQIAQEVRRAKGELQAEVGAIATQIAERLIRKSLRDEDHQRIVQEALARMDSA
jgi:F-type H+-transporting ATPase subunit b